MRTTEWLRAALRDEWDGLGAIWRDVRLADFATMMNAFLGVAAILMAARGETVIAIELVLLGVIVDGVDGFIARLGFGGGPLGPTLDTLADVVTFGVAPAVILFQATGGWPGGVAAGVLLAAVLLRLARFEGMRGAGPRGYFSGLSSPGAALTVLAMLFYAGDVMPDIVHATALVMAVLMLSRVRYPKLLGLLGVTAVAVILAVVAGHGRPWQDTAVLVMLAFMAVYLLAGPFYVLSRYGATYKVA